MKKLIIVLLSIFTLTGYAQNFKNTCVDSRCEKPIMPNGYYYDYAFSNYVECDINNIKLKTDEDVQRRLTSNLSGSHNYQIYVAQKGTWKLIGSFYLCEKHNGKKLYFKPGNKFAIGQDNKEPFELDIPQPKAWKVK